MNKKLAREIGASRMPCPNCEKPLNFTLDKLFSGVPIKCRSCNAKLEVNRSESHEGLAALDKASKLLQQAKLGA